MIDFKLTNPVEVQPEEPKVYDKLWLKKITITSPCPNEEGYGRAEFAYYRHIKDEQGNVIGNEIKHPSNIDLTIDVTKLFELCAKNENAQKAMDAIMLFINEEGQRQGIFHGPLNPVVSE